MQALRSGYYVPYPGRTTSARDGQQYAGSVAAEASNDAASFEVRFVQIHHRLHPPGSSIPLSLIISDGKLLRANHAMPAPGAGELKTDSAVRLF